MGQVFSNIIENCNCGSQSNNDKDEEQDKEISEIKRDIKIIKENHLFHIQQDISEMKTDIKIISNNVNSLLIRTAN